MKSQATPEMLEALGIKNPAFPKEKVRSNAIDILSTISHLSQHERKRVLAQALKLNEV